MLPICALSLLLTGCQLIPAEEVFPTAPVLQSYEAQEYVQTIVLRGDIELAETVDCVYMPVREEALSFNVSGEYFDSILVSLGQQVHAGELLAQLEGDGLDSQMEKLAYQQKVLTLQKEHLVENRPLELELLDRQLQSMKWEYQEPIRQEDEEEYNLRLQTIEDAIYINSLRLEELNKAYEERRLYAGFDGTVTYVKKIEDKQLSKAGQRIIEIADMNTSTFVVEGEKAAYFPVGTQVEIVKKDAVYTAVSVEAAEVGLPEEASDAGLLSDDNKTSEKAYLMLVQPDPLLEDGDKGTIKVVLDARKDVLYVDKK